MKNYHDPLISKYLGEPPVSDITHKAKKYLKWLVIGGIIFAFVTIFLIILIGIGVFNFIVMPLLQQAPNLTLDTQNLWLEGQRWLQTFTGQNSAELEALQQEVQSLRQVIETVQPTSTPALE